MLRIDLQTSIQTHICLLTAGYLLIKQIVALIHFTKIVVQKDTKIIIFRNIWCICSHDVVNLQETICIFVAKKNKIVEKKSFKTGE